MNAKELRAVAKTMRDFGITHFKCDAYELSISITQAANAALPAEKKTLRRNKAKADQEPEQEIKHKVEELTSLMKVGDKELVDILFPDHAQEESA